MDRDRSPMRRDGERSGGGGDSSNFSGDSTTNPATVDARIFVGSIESDITTEALEDYFSKYGRVTGVAITKNKFGFVQFEHPDSARQCLGDGNVAQVNGRNLDVKPAKIGSDKDRSGSDRDRGGGDRGRGSDRGGSRGGMMHPRDYPPRDIDHHSSHGRYPHDDYYGRGRDHLPPPRDRYEDRYSDYYAAGRNGGAPPPTYPPPREGERYREPPEPLDPLDPSRPNDVEIVVPNKMQREYAETIEQQLKRMNILVDLLFPPPDIQPARVLQDLSSRRCLYAIFVTAENEKHKSMTVNILHGTPQEHRNMPVEDALRLIQQNFDEYVKKIRFRNMREVVPKDIRNLMLDVIESKPVSMGDLDKMIKYLRERQSFLVDDQIEQKREISGGSAAMTRNMAVTYPGYNYPNGGVSGGASATSGVGVVGLPATATVAPQSAASYSAYGVQGGADYNMYSVQAAAIMGQTGSANKQSELQDRILSLMKGQVVPQSSSLTGPAGVPAPSAVPPPNLQSSWMTGKPNDSAGKGGQGNPHSVFYSAWN